MLCASFPSTESPTNKTKPLPTNEPYRETCAHQGKQRAEAASHTLPTNQLSR
ncbi:AAEL015259-PA [Aedes aegypti]|uniref:AAEL015259-PA n=1 Tax=Aedes aegypti TaxID=7159 RepID=Q16ED3_AEDAE|nr:AAEL015259-PA [Aedes aegypti]